MDNKITVQIDSADLEALKKARYRFCIAGRLKDEDFNTVWYASDAYAPNNTITLMEEYQVFASNSYSPREIISLDYPPVAIDMGEDCTLDSYGIFSGARTGENPDSIVLVNGYGLIHPGLIRKGRGLKKELFASPVYLSAVEILPGRFEFLPSQLVRLWFAQDADTGMAYPQNTVRKGRSAITLDIIIDLEKRPAPVICYSHGIWKFI